MNRGYISTLYPSELILMIKMTSSNVLPAPTEPMMSAFTVTHCVAFSLAPLPGLQPPGCPPHFSFSVCLLRLSCHHALACEESQGEVSLLHTQPSAAVAPRLSGPPGAWGQEAGCRVLLPVHPSSDVSTGRLPHPSYPPTPPLLAWLIPGGKGSLDAIRAFVFCFVLFSCCVSSMLNCEWQ